MTKKIPNVVTIGGGTGTYTILSALKKYNVKLSAIVSMYDDGGSTGRLRDEYGVLPPGDIRRSLIALSSADSKLRELFDFRFKSGQLKGHNFGNLFLTALEKMSGSFYDAVKTASSVLDVRGDVLPVTLDDVRLYAELENGKIISGEKNIDIPKHNPRLKIKKIFTKPKARVNKDALLAIQNADAIIIGPGDLYTSILPNFLVSGIASAVVKSKAKKIYTCNLMTKRGETNGYKVNNFIESVEKYLGSFSLDYILVNTKKPSPERLRKYIKENAELVSIKSKFNHDKRLIKGNLMTNKGLIRHDQKKLGKIIMKLIS